MPGIMTKILLGPLALALLASLLAGQQSPPDLILLNGKIFTSDAAHPDLEALAIRGERIVATGTSEKIGALAGPQTKRIDLGGRVVIPGINEAHYHCVFEPAGFPSAVQEHGADMGRSGGGSGCSRSENSERNVDPR